jgi:hypothetical protein
MSLRINDLSPNFTADSTAGKLTAVHDCPAKFRRGMLGCALTAINK